MMNPKYSAPLALLLTLSLLSLTSCNGVTVVSDVTSVLGVVETVLPTVLALTGSNQGPLESYLKDATTALDQVSAIVTQGGTATGIAEKITSALTTVVAESPGTQGLLDGLPITIISAIGTIGADLSNLLQANGTAALTSHVRAQTIYHVSANDQVRLASIHLRCQAVLQQMAR